MIKWDLFQGCKDDSMSTNKSMWYTRLTSWRRKIMIISIDAEKAFDKIQHLFRIKKKNPQQSGYTRSIPWHDKSHIYQTHSQCYIQNWKGENTSPKIRNKTKMSILTTFIQHSIGSPSHSNQTRKINNRNSNWE